MHLSKSGLFIYSLFPILTWIAIQHVFLEYSIKQIGVDGCTPLCSFPLGDNVVSLRFSPPQWFSSIHLLAESACA